MSSIEGPKRRVLVTGSSRGIGSAIACELGRQGWQVAVHFSQDLAGAQQTVELLGTQSDGCYQADLSDLVQVRSLIERTENDSKLDAVVNNAGIYRPLPFLGSSDAEFDHCWRQSLAVNLEAPLFISREAGKRFAARGAGKILNVASRVGFKGESGAAIYAATKAALVNLTRSLAVELAPHGVTFFGIAPGWVETAMVRDGMTAKREEVLATLPLGRMASVEDCAATSAFLLSDAASYLSGQFIDINGASYFH